MSSKIVWFTEEAESAFQDIVALCGRDYVIDTNPGRSQAFEWRRVAPWTKTGLLASIAAYDRITIRDVDTNKGSDKTHAREDDAVLLRLRTVVSVELSMALSEHTQRRVREWDFGSMHYDATSQILAVRDECMQGCVFQLYMVKRWANEYESIREQMTRSKYARFYDPLKDTPDRRTHARAAFMSMYPIVVREDRDAWIETGRKKSPGHAFETMEHALFDGAVEKVYYQVPEEIQALYEEWISTDE